jgi:hypothetical protein
MEIVLCHIAEQFLITKKNSMKRILFAGLVMLCLSVAASAQKTSDKQVQKNRIEKTFKKGGDGKFDKSKFGKYDGLKKMWKRHSGKKGFAHTHGSRKMYGKKMKKGEAFRFKQNRQGRRS